MNSLIDPPVSIYSSKEELQRWLEELQTYPDSKEKTFAINQAKRWINIKEKEPVDRSK